MSTPDRVDRVLAGLDFRRRVGQLNQRLLGWQAVERGPRGWRLSELGEKEIDRWGGLGALYGLFRADAWSGRSWADGIHPDERAEVAALVQGEVRAAGGIGVLLSEEAPHGHQALGGTPLPTALSMAATFDPELVAEASAAVAAQLSASGVHLALVSTLDLLRDPRWGRAEECFGEDPFLASLLTAAVVEGMQGVDRSRVGADGVAVCLKHLAAQGETTGGRNGQSSVIGRRDLDELHLPMVRAGVEAGALSLMAAYNDVDGVPCCADPSLLQAFLRDELDFDGVVVADGLAVDRLDALTGGAAASGRLALLSGVDLSLWDDGFAALEQLEDDPAVQAAVERSCRRVLALKDRFGLLDEVPAADAARPSLRLALAAGRETGRRLAQASLVLLDDPSQRLPLAAAGRVLVAGPFADEGTALLGDYVPPLDPPAAGIATALAAAHEGDVVVAASTEEAERLAPGCAAVVLVLGGTSHRPYDAEFAANGALGAASVATCGEGVDVADVDLPDDQLDLLARVTAAAEVPVVAVVVAGRPHVLTPVHDVGATLVWAGYPGPDGGAAVARALLGRAPVSGRLPFTLPRHSGVIPVRHNDRHGADGVYRDAPQTVLHLFGAGLVTDEPAVVDVTTRSAPDGAVLRVRLAAAAGARRTSLPVYAHRHGGAVLPRRRELVAVLRAGLPAGEGAARGPAEDLVLETVLPWDRLRAPGAHGSATATVVVAGHRRDLAVPPPRRPAPHPI